MQHISFASSYDTAILIKDSALRNQPIKDTYISKLPLDWGCVAFSLDYGGKKKPNKLIMESYLATLVPVLHKLGIKRCIVADGEYFKRMTGLTKTTGSSGYVFTYEGMQIVLAPSYQALYYNPEIGKDIALSLNALIDDSTGDYVELGADVIRTGIYPKSLQEIKDNLAHLHQYPALTCDVETFSLKHHEAGIGTIAFAWGEHSGVAFTVDWQELLEPIPIVSLAGNKTKKVCYGKQVKNLQVRALLREFFETYKGKLIYHNMSFDGYILVYQLWMNDLLDQAGMLNGLDIIHDAGHCTKIITYLATNTTAGNKLGLKHQSHEFTGNYAEEDIKDITLIAKQSLLQYNLVDCCATWFVMDKHYPTLVFDEQWSVYHDTFRPAIKDVIQMQLTGLCLDMAEVLKTEVTLSDIRDKALTAVLATDVTKSFVQDRVDLEVVQRNAEYKNKVIDSSEAKFVFNPNSNPQLQELLYDYMTLPIIDLTKEKQPATGGKTIKKLLNHVDSIVGITPADAADYKVMLSALIDFALTDKIIGTFIKAFKLAPLASDGMYYLFGNFNLGGAVSGRLSSSGPNLQNLK